jgi:histidine triad (HIT) family protein
MECLFCKIIRGEIPALKVFENAQVVAFLDIHPINPGHTLVVPKGHYTNLLETPDEVIGEVMQNVKVVAEAAMKAVGASAFNLGVNTGVEAGQVIMHTHFHVMPRFANDGHVHWAKKEMGKEEMEKVAMDIRDALGA